MREPNPEELVKLRKEHPGVVLVFRTRIQRFAAYGVDAELLCDPDGFALECNDSRVIFGKELAETIIGTLIESGRKVSIVELTTYDQTKTGNTFSRKLVKKNNGQFRRKS